MFELSEVVSEGTSVAAAAPPEVSAAPVAEEGGGTLLEVHLKKLKDQLSNEQPSDEGK